MTINNKILVGILSIPGVIWVINKIWDALDVNKHIVVEEWYE